MACWMSKFIFCNLVYLFENQIAIVAAQDQFIFPESIAQFPVVQHLEESRFRFQCGASHFGGNNVPECDGSFCEFNRAAHFVAAAETHHPVVGQVEFEVWGLSGTGYRLAAYALQGPDVVQPVIAVPGHGIFGIIAAGQRKDQQRKNWIKTGHFFQFAYHKGGKMVSFFQAVKQS